MSTSSLASRTARKAAQAVRRVHAVPRTTISFTLADDAPGALQEVLRYFWKHDANLARIESRVTPHGEAHEFIATVDAAGEQCRRLIEELRSRAGAVRVLGPVRAPWFPRRQAEVDLFANEILSAGHDLESDHPGFHDEAYRARRAELASVARAHVQGRPIPRVDYTEAEVGTWRQVYERLVPLQERHGCRRHNECREAMRDECGFAPDNIPQHEDINQYLQGRTGFRLSPTSGLLSPRNFLYGLAFRTFFCTQYIRHHSRPLYTPEPDVVHEVLGHVPLFSDPEFAEFSQQIGLAALGASDEQVLALTRCYWYTVEFGLCLEGGERKAFGAGLLSSIGELEYAMSGEPEVRPWDPTDAAGREYPITTYQPVYYQADSFRDATNRLREFTESFARPFRAFYDPLRGMVELDRDVAMDARQ